MSARVASAALVGMDARPVEVEVALVPGLPEVQIVGLASGAVREAKQRLKAAVPNAGEQWPNTRVTISLAPSDIRKDGSLLDLPIAMGVLCASGSVDQDDLIDKWFIGELALDGRVRGVRGALAVAISCRSAGKTLILPRDNSAEAALVEGLDVVGVETLTEALAFVAGGMEAPPVFAKPSSHRTAIPDLSDVKGQALGRRCLEIAAVGGHNALMVGPPGSGKTMLARRLVGILPPMDAEETLEVTRIWSVAGLLPVGVGCIGDRPFRSPHHHASAAAICGGGSPTPRPGEISLAHRGVLFMDEMPLFSRGVLDSLRQPMEEGFITVARHGGTYRFPASFSLIGAANPCPCGPRTARCNCAPGRLEMYRSKLSGPLTDRFDLHVEVPRLNDEELLELGASEPSLVVARRVCEAMEFRSKRPEIASARDLLSSVDSDGRSFLRSAFRDVVASARALDRTLKVARTIADLSASERIEVDHLAEALQFRKEAWS